MGREVSLKIMALNRRLGGQSAGVARGKFTIDTSGVVTAERQSAESFSNMTKTASDYNKELRSLIATQRQVGSVSQATGGAIASIASRFKDASRAAKEFKNSNLGQIQQGIDAAQRSMNKLSVAAGLFTAGGLAAAQQVQRLNALMLVLSGSQQKANQRMAELRAIADRTGQSFLQVAEGALAILPAVGRANVDLGQTLSIMQRLAVLDPAQGVQGAAFAVRELLSGSTVSLASRFELPKAQLRNILDQAGGDPQKVIAGLDEMINKMGLTQAAFEKMGAQGVNAFSALKGEVTETLATAFTPLLTDVVIPLVRGFTAFIRNLRETNPELLKIVSVFAVAVAAVAPLLLILSQLITAYKTLKTVSAFTSGLGNLGAAGGVLAKAGVTAAALGVGVDIGKRVVTGLGTAVANDEGLRRNADRILGGVGSSSADLVRIGRGEDAGAVIGERFKQIIVIFINALLEGAKTLVKLFAGNANIIGQALDLLFNVLKLGGSLLQQGFGKLQEAIASGVIGFSDLLNGLGLTDASKTVGQAGLNLLDVAFANQQAGLQSQFDAQNRLARGLDMNEVRAAVENSVVGLEEVRKTVVGGLTGLLFPVEQAAGDVESAMRYAGTGIQAAGNSLAANIAENAELLKDTQAEAKDLLDEFNAEVAKVTEERDIKAAREAFDNALRLAREARDFNKRMADEDAAFYKGRAAAIANHYADMQSLQTQALEQQAQALADYRKDDARRAEDHGRRLTEIQRDTDTAVEKAASRLDAAAVFDAFASGRQEINDEQDKYELDRQRRAEDFAQQQQQLVASLEKQRQQKQTAYEQQLIDDLTAFQERRAQELADRALRQADEAQDRQIQQQRQAEDYAREDRLRQEAYSKRLQALVQQLTTEGTLNQSFITQMQGVLGRSRNDLLGFYNYLSAITSALPGAYGTPTPSPTTAPAVFTPFAAGGIPSLNRPVRINDGGGLESAYIRNQLVAFTQPARIFNAQQTAALLGGGGHTVNLGGVSAEIVLGDIGQHSPATIKAMVRDGLMEVLDQLPIPKR